METKYSQVYVIFIRFIYL